MDVQVGSPQVRQRISATSSVIEMNSAAQLTQMELDSLLEDIDFAEDFEMSEDDFHSAAGSPLPSSPHATLRTRRGRPSPLSASCEPDLFSPKPSSFHPPLPSSSFKSSAASFALSPLRVSSASHLHAHSFSTSATSSSRSSFLDTISALVDREPRAAAKPKFKLKTKPKPKPKPKPNPAAKVIELESDDDVVVISGGGMKGAQGSDSEVEILTKPTLGKAKAKTVPAKSTATKVAPPKPSTKAAAAATAKGGWFTRSPFLIASSQPAFASTAKSSQPQPPHDKASRTYKFGSAAFKNAQKRERNEAREKELKEKHEPFRHERWPTKPRLVYTVDPAVVEKELAAMTG